MRFGPKAALGVAALVGALALGTSANAAITSLTFNKCLSGKIKQSGKGVAAYTGCHAKGASKNLPTDGACITKASGKSTVAYGKLDTKGGCLTTGDGASRDTDAQNYALAVDTAVGHGSPGPTPNNNKCDAAKQKLVGKYVAAITGCYAKSAGKAGAVPPNGIPIDSICTGKALTKLNDGIAKAQAKPPCTNTNSVVAAADAFIQTHTCLLDPANPGCGGTCGNGANDPGEKCDASAPSAGWATCGPTFTCVACNCACPTKVRFSGDATAPESILDTGWSGISHRAPIISNGDVRVGLSCAAANRPCGTCQITGVQANGPGELKSQRCKDDSSVVCTSNAQCPGVGNSCAFYFGSNLPLAAGGVTTCVANTFVGNVTGTANVESGDAATTANLNARVFLGISVDNPCARCIGDTTINDGVAGGTCNGGTRNNLACDANGFAPGRPDFGQTSLDCPLAPGAIIANLPVDLTNSTGTVTKTLSASSPKCRANGFTNQNCLCDTCNNLAQAPCTSNTGCPASGGGAGICGGKRCINGPVAGSPCLQCINGANHGANCTVASQCPGGSCNTTCGVCLTGAPALIGVSCNVNAGCGKACVGGANNLALCANNSACPGGACVDGTCEGNCAVPGRSSASNECDDNTATAEIDCSDDGDGEGTCIVGPLDSNCTFASGHPQRGCLGDGDCGGGGGSCGSANRKCFLTGGLGAMTGTNTLTAVGMADLPMGDASSPTLGAVFCVGPTGQAAVNNVAGLPGPGRVTIKGNAAGLP